MIGMRQNDKRRVNAPIISGVWLRRSAIKKGWRLASL